MGRGLPHGTDKCTREVPQSGARPEANYNSRGTTEEDWQNFMIRSDTACLACEVRNSPTCLLVAAIWLRLKRKYMKSGMAKDACTMFDVSVKHLSKILLGKKYAGGGNKKNRDRNT